MTRGLGNDTGFCHFRYKKDGNVVIHREIHVENNRSVWMLNKRHCSQKDVEEEVRTLQIQVSNLCQFLPQVLYEKNSICSTFVKSLKSMVTSKINPISFFI